MGVFQTRGHSFVDFLRETDTSNNGGVMQRIFGVGKPLNYPVDTVNYDGKVTTEYIDICCAGTVGSAEGKAALQELLSDQIQVIGVGVTEAGLNSPNNQCMLDLTWVIFELYSRSAGKDGKICIVNTDNLPNNGDVMKSHVLSNVKLYEEQELRADISFFEFVTTRTVFLNSMVDRITSSRKDSKGMVPSCEPLPQKALVICDPGSDLPQWSSNEQVQKKFGVRIRHHEDELASDISLKLRVANGTHTALAHAMALSSLSNTETLSSIPVILSYLDSLFTTQILPAAISEGISKEETESTWLDWRKRVQHPHFGLSTFFITQNGAAKGGIRLGPSVRSLVNDFVSYSRVEVSFSLVVH